MRRIALFSACLFAALTSSACGSLADDPGTLEPLAVLRGQLTNPDAINVKSDVRVAVIWVNYAGGNSGSYSVAQDVAVQPVFPSQFSLELVAPPPESALMTDPKGNPDASSSTDFRMAIGGIVAYEDLNGNGMLDLAGPTDTAFVDRIVGATDSLLLTWFQGTIPASIVDTDGHAPSLGFNLLSMPPSTDTTDQVPYCFPEYTPSNGDSMSFETKFLPVDSVISLPLSADPRLAEWMCESPAGSTGSSGSGVGLPSSFPKPDDPGLKCSADGRAYYWESCIQAGVCSGTDCTSECYALDATQPAPAGWPCAVR